MMSHLVITNLITKNNTLKDSRVDHDASRRVRDRKAFYHPYQPAGCIPSWQDCLGFGATGWN